MTTFTPKETAELAEAIYRVQNEMTFEFLTVKEVFRTKGKDKTKSSVLKADVGGRILLAAKDNFGACAMAGDKYPGAMVMMFRGTTTANNKADFLTDARIGISLSDAGIPVHNGFQSTFSSMLPDIRRFVAENVGAATSIHCIGHSLGGAVASLAADWAARNTNKPVSLYTYGQPRVGTELFVRSTSKKIGPANIYRCFHKTDPVPMVPLYPYMHAPHKANGYFLPSSQPLVSGEAHKMANYIESVAGQSWEQLSGIAQDPFTLESSIENWLKSKSPVSTSSPTFWRWLDSAIIYVLKKVLSKALGALALGLQGVLISGFTVADKLAYILSKGIDLAEHLSIWVERLVRKMMSALGMKAAKSKDEMTRDLIRTVLLKLTDKANREARKAIKKLNG
ncbi:lipase family protein [Sessilibacter sp. MAH2]